MSSRVTSWVALLALAIACNKSPTPTAEPAPAPALKVPAPAAPAPAAPAIAMPPLDSLAVALTCGDKPLALPARTAPAGAPAEKALARQKPIPVCTGEPSPAAVCACLASNVAKWTEALHAPVTCTPSDKYKDANVQVLEVTSTPDDPDTTGPGTVLVLAAHHGTAWSAAGLIEISPDIDRETAPKQSGTAAIDRFELKPAGDGTLAWIESHHQTEETAEGEWSKDGEASTTICRVPAAAAPFCYVELPRGTWTYDEDVVDAKGGCQVQNLATYAQHLEGSAVTVTLDHGSDAAPVGRYKL